MLQLNLNLVFLMWRADHPEADTCSRRLGDERLWVAVLLHLFHVALLHFHLIVIIIQHFLHSFFQLLAPIPGHLRKINIQNVNRVTWKWRLSQLILFQRSWEVVWLWPSAWACLQSLAETPEPARTPRWWRWPQTQSSCRLFRVPWLGVSAQPFLLRSEGSLLETAGGGFRSESCIWREESSVFLICGRKPEHQEKTHTQIDSTCALHGCSARPHLRPVTKAAIMIIW